MYIVYVLYFLPLMVTLVTVPTTHDTSMPRHTATRPPHRPSMGCVLCAVCGPLTLIVR